MMKEKNKIILLIGMVLCVCSHCLAQHPSLFFTSSEVKEIQEKGKLVPGFARSVSGIIQAADEAMAAPLSVPVPVDGGGGVIHERHKSNYYAMFHCGVAYQLTGRVEYARYVGSMLEAYAALYPTLGYHPLGLSSSPGRLFWQTLNESVWLVHTAVAYDCVYDALTASQRESIEKDLFVPMADFIMNGMGDNHINRDIFNRMHNHATWATSAVGMIGMAMDRKEYVSKALLGTDETGLHGGFLQQMDELFSPDGYYTEGLYYERYAIWPFVMFAQCIEHRMPELRIFERRDGILYKALDTLLQMSYEGEFFHINDALQKGLSCQELIYAVNILYGQDPSHPSYIAASRQYQHGYLPTLGGLRVAEAVEQGGQRMEFRSGLWHDGYKGDQGGVAVIRSQNPKVHSALTLKATSHGLSHGHFDKLTMAYYDNGKEILKDYGAARFLNLEAKYKGHYTHENNTFVKQTIAHNTLVVDEKSHFNGNTKESSKYHAEVVYSDFSRDDIQLVVACDTNACPGVSMERNLAYITTSFLPYPLIVDIMRARGTAIHQYDLPYWYAGHFVSLNLPYQKADTVMRVLGRANGYQHLWVEAEAEADSAGVARFTFFNGNRLYTLSTAVTPTTELKFIRLGANDPDFNLRNETAYLLREKGKTRHTFATAIETHGEYDVVAETSSDLVSSCEGVNILTDTDSSTVVRVRFKGDHEVVVCLSNDDRGAEASHCVKADGREYSWQGAYGLFMK